MDLAEPIRTALLEASGIANALPTYANAKTVFTRRPVPDNAPYPIIMVSSDVSVVDQDGVNDERPVIVRDIAVYGRNETPAHYRAVETLGYAIRTLFHRQRHALSVAGWNVIDIIASGPRAAPTDDLDTVGRLVELTVRLARN
jgi:hypothetical protein